MTNEVRRRASLVGLAVLMIALVTGRSSIVIAADQIPAPGSTIKVGSTLDLAPLDMVDQNGNATGFELDVVTAVMKKLGYKVEWVKTTFEQAFTGLLAGKYRFNASAIYTRCTRVQNTDKYGQFTVPVGQAGQAVATLSKNASGVHSYADLKDKALGVESAGSTADGLADKNASAGFKKQIFPDNNALFLALEQGRIYAAGQSSDVTRYTIRGKPQMTVAFIVPDSTLTYGWVFRAGDPLRDRVNQEINTLKRNGTTAQIYKKWFGASPDPSDAAVKILPGVTPQTCKG
jgi:polar amino acid transport system substrate-binding protein